MRPAPQRMGNSIGGCSHVLSATAKVYAVFAASLRGLHSVRLEEGDRPGCRRLLLRCPSCRFVVSTDGPFINAPETGFADRYRTTRISVAYEVGASGRSAERTATGPRAAAGRRAVRVALGSRAVGFASSDGPRAFARPSTSRKRCIWGEDAFGLVSVGVNYCPSGDMGGARVRSRSC